MRPLLFVLLIAFVFCSAKSNNNVYNPLPEVEGESKSDTLRSNVRDELYNKVLGAVIGSAIGDAMGAPTEMWTRKAIQSEYGYVNRLDSMVREPSAEGTWAYNLPAGGTTDDTRWKRLAIDYLATQRSGKLDAKAFAVFIVNQYKADIKALKNTDSFDPEPFEAGARRMAWLQEWARVAKPFAEGDLLGYTQALNRFYGGEMTCAGMLYTPAVGVFFPGNPAKAYNEAFNIGLFDIGYARDISALTAAMVSAAMQKDATPVSIINVVRDVDPQGFFKSRLVGRSAYRMLKDVRTIVYEANQLQLKDVNVATVPFLNKPKTDTLYMARLQRAYERLDAYNQDLPFHAGEIYMITLTALLFGDFDVEKTLAFVINYGRDNDTAGAVAGAILGAYWGASRLPKPMVDKVLATNKKVVGVDLEALATKLTDAIRARK